MQSGLIKVAFVSLLVLFTPVFRANAAANEAVNWRLWNTDDGMVEAYITQMTRTPSGQIIVRNGDVPRLNVMDGVRLWTSPDLPSLGRIEADASGDLYTFNRSGVLIFNKGSWNRRPMPELARFNEFGLFEHYAWFDYPAFTDMNPRVGAVVSGRGKMLFAFPDRLIEWSRDGTQRVIREARAASIGDFVDVSRAQNGGFFVSGGNGLALLSADTEHWTELPKTSGTSNRLVLPFMAPDGRIIATAGAPNANKQLLLYEHGVWKVLYSGAKKLRGWETRAGSIWAMEDTRLLSIQGGKVREVSLRPWLTGRMIEALPDGDSFWLGTMQGLARYSPPLWQLPEGAPEVDATVSSIAQDNDGRLWFAGGDTVISHSGTDWRTYQLPNGVKHDFGKTGSICPMDNGRILILPTDSSYLLELDPANGHFRAIPHPRGHKIKWIARRSGSSIWAQSLVPGASTSQIEVFDGTRFSALPGGEAIPTTDIRCLLTTKAGVIWTGGTGSVVRIVNGRMQTFGKNDRPPELSAFSLAEDSSGTIFIGHRDAISSFDGHQFHVLRRGMDRVRTMAVSADNALWAASGTGVHRYKNGGWVTNGVEEGLPANPAYTVFADRAGRIWAGTTLGLSLYHRESDLEAPVTTIYEDQNLRKSAPGGEVRFAFSGMDRWKKTPESRLLFSWKLDGGSWSPFDKATLAAVRSLPSGAHRFEVRAMDRNGNIDPNPAHFDFSVLLPWYRENGFYFLAGILALALGVLAKTGYNYHRNLRFQSRHDALTGLPNRLQFEEALAAAIDKPKASELAVMFIDLDGFKGVNDALGHPAGDKVLVDVGTKLRQALGRGDLLARLGGDEFAILLCSASSREEVGLIADRILAIIRGCSPNLSLSIAGSIGISLFPEHGSSASVLVRLADLAMYQSKSRNGDCRLFFDASMKVDFRTAEMAGLLRTALRDGNLVQWYQPIIDRQHRVARMECLVRINDPALGIISPVAFIGVAEETGLIHQVGAWVLREAAKTASTWLASGCRIPVAVNVSPVQLERSELADEILDCLVEYGLPPSSLAIEITEGAIIKNQSRAVEILSRLRAAGVTISLDDFGTGYSSLSMLDGMPLDEIKLDRSFAQSITGERTRDVICQTVSLARKLNVAVVAEGIEEAAQMDAALELGCDLFQGYLIAPPLEKEMATQFIMSQSTTVNDLHALSCG